MRRLLVVVLLSILGLGLTVGTAMAHDRLDSSDPAPGTTLTTAPRQITLNFAEAPDPSGAAISVTGPAGGHLEAGAPTINGSAVTAALVSDVPTGSTALYGAWCPTTDTRSAE